MTNKHNPLSPRGKAAEDQFIREREKEQAKQQAEKDKKHGGKTPSDAKGSSIGQDTTKGKPADAKDKASGKPLK